MYLSRNSIGITLLLVYAIYNMVNILYLYATIPTIYILVSICAVYIVVRALNGMSLKILITQSEMFGLLLIFLIVCTVLLQNILLNTHVDNEGVDIVSNLTKIAKVSIMWFFVGAASSQFDFNESAAVAALVIIGVATAMFFAIDESLTIPFSTIRDESGLESVSHLGIERPVVLLSLIHI